MPKIVVLRHGKSLWNEENRFTGSKNPDLTSKGEDEAREAGVILRQATDIQLTQVFSSTQLRANRTAEIALNVAGLNSLFLHMVRAKELNERDYGDLTGLNKKETAQKHGEEQVRIWRRSYDIAPPNGESLKDVVEKRVRPYYESDIKKYLEKKEDVLVAAHGNSIRALFIAVGAETPETVVDADLPTGVPIVLEMDNDLKFVERYTLKLAA
ncbi:MAG: 2,3-diphosphoglycerate-dependent phosphoglycerate mutase [Alphaproteobacteria bacterium]|nr:2,3-diphosphoglycerate-dependent phosphoglycerate mutase [Alphaproteobacteria bacterium]